MREAGAVDDQSSRHNEFTAAIHHLSVPARGILIGILQPTVGAMIMPVGDMRVSIGVQPQGAVEANRALVVYNLRVPALGILIAVS